MNITQQEAIQLIIDFLAPLHGFWEDMPIDDPIIEQFISLEYAELDESKGKYEINKKGVDKLYPYIEKITKDFIAYIKPKSLSCFNEEAIEWFSYTYKIDRGIADSLYDYTTLVIEKFGYERRSFRQNGKDGYSFVECLKDK